MSWQDYFSAIIIERGYDYYANDCVLSIRKTEDGYDGIVSGTEDYLVHIHTFDINDEAGFAMDCTCPYAADGEHCKHMAAMLFAIEEMTKPPDSSTIGVTGYSHDSSQKKNKLRDIVDALHPDIVRQELTDILEDSENLRARFMMKYERTEENITAYIYRMRDTARSIRYQCSDHHGFVDWRHAGTYANRLVGEVIAELHDFASADVEEAKAAFDVSLFVYDLFADTDIDDDGQAQLIADECLDLWAVIFSKADDIDLKKHMFDELSKECVKLGLGEYMSDEIDAFLADRFNDRIFREARLDTIDGRLEQFKNDSGWHSIHELSKSVMERLTLMEEFKHPSREIEAFKRSYWQLPAVREARMRELELSGESDKLILLLEESKNMDWESPGLVSKYSRMLINCYKKGNDRNRAITELFAFVTIYSRGNLDAFIELKQYYNETEWPHKREEIFDALISSRTDIVPLLAAEGLKGRLYESLSTKWTNNKGYAKFILAEIRRYERFLQPEYNEELLGFYEKLIDETAAFAGGRKHYQELVSFIRAMLPYPGGEERVEKMLADWRFRYANRPAMQEELLAVYRR